MKLGILFAGQGSQQIGMGQDLYNDRQEFKEVFDLLTEEQKKIAWGDSKEEISDTRNTQPLMVAFALGVYACLKKAGITPDMAAGLSLGEYSALGAAGVFDNETAIKLVTRRALEMHKASKGIDCEMKAIMGLDTKIVEECCKSAGSDGIVQITNLNCPGQIVIGGDAVAVEKAAGLAEEKGARRCMQLAVSGPFHTQFMNPAGEALKEIFSQMEVGKMDFPVIFNATGKPPKEGETISDLLVRQVSSTVLFEDTVKYMTESGIDTVIEIGPGKVLSGFLRKIDKSIKVYQMENTQTLEEVIESLKGVK